MATPTSRISALPLLRPGGALYTTLREKWAGGIRCPSDVAFAFGVSLIWLTFYNLRFWEQTLVAMWHPAAGSVAFLLSLAVLVVSLQAILLLLMPTRTLMRAAASLLFIVAAATSYFCNTYGAVMNKDMMRNVLQTDPAEVGGLFNFNMLAQVILLGVIPAILVWRVVLPRTPWPVQLRQRAVYIVAALALSTAGLFACSANYAVFFREHKPIRYLVVPAAPVSSLVGLMTERGGRDPNRPLLNPAGKSERVAARQAKPLVMFLVIGETARAANFQLGGYTRATNEHLAAENGLVYFDRASSCGTATAISVPCIFSGFTRSQFNVDEADRNTNLLDSLVAAGFDVEWRDNNAGCKGVCDRVRQISYTDRPDARLCPESYCYDEVMLTDLAQRLRTIERDTVIVFHQIGSHGPAYSERYPPQFEKFKPACRSNQLQRCTPQEIVNAYDNTIAYTDYVLSRQIGLLRAAAGRVDGVLIYASDHGESLGEQGIYLHGMPYGFAPRAQKEVPMLIWTSQGYTGREGLRSGCLGEQAGAPVSRGIPAAALVVSLPVSHDNLYHTVLGAAGVRNQIYQSGLDLLARCRA